MKKLPAIYFLLCLFAATAEPTGEKSDTYYVCYYAVVIANMAIAVLLINRNLRKNATTTN